MMILSCGDTLIENLGKISENKFLTEIIQMSGKTRNLLAFWYSNTLQYYFRPRDVSHLFLARTETGPKTPIRTFFSKMSKLCIINLSGDFWPRFRD